MATRRQTASERTSSAFEQAARAAGLELHPGLSAVKNEYRPGVTLKSGHRHTASIDMDASFIAAEPTAPRWDYGIGIRGETGQEGLIWLEPHPASSTGEVQKMLNKLAWLKTKLAQPAFDDLRRLEHKGSAYRWLAMTGAIRILPNSPEARRLAKAGLSQPQRRIELP
jgi:hypothetical protein